MRKATFLKLFVGVAVLTCTVSLYGGGYADMPTLQKAKFKAEDLEKGTLSITRKDVDVTLKGRVRQDYLFYDKIYTLRASNNDQLNAFRTKACLDLAGSFGRQTYGRSAADGFLRWTNYGFWKAEGFYTPMTTDQALDVNNLDAPMELLSWIEEAWIDLHFGTFFKAYDGWTSLEKHPVSLKIGYFPYELGRGISFGDSPMHIPYLGWESYRYDDTRYNHPGILVHGKINKDISYELYYSKQTEISISRSFTWLQPHANSIATKDFDGRALTHPYRGVAKDRDLWAAKMDLKHERKWGDLHVQPYMMYIDAPELKIEYEGDSCARLGTVGMMMNFKRGRLKVNAEVASQFGHQQVHAIDRNQVEDGTRTDGYQSDVYTHVFGNTNLSGDKAIKTSPLAAVVNKNFNKGGVCEDSNQVHPGVTFNGRPIGSTFEYLGGYAIVQGDTLAATGQDLLNSNETGNARFRDNYRLDYRGFMGLIDAKYKFEEVPVSVSAAMAYISGDKYPFNNEQNKRYKAFIPYGDYNYIGKYVISQIVLDAKKLPRPVDISYHHQYAHNNVKDCSNLMYCGLGAKWKPFANKKKLMLRSHLMWFWETTTLKKWDKHASLPMKWNPVNSRQENIILGKRWGVETHAETSWKGWMACEDASRMLGTELNFEAQYRPVPNCIFLLQIACFLPGQLYKDLDGQPNERTKSGPKAKLEGVYGLGHDPVWRIASALDFRF